MPGYEDSTSITYPFTTDAPDWRQVQNFAMTVDAQLHAAEMDFRSSAFPTSFVMTASGNTINLASPASFSPFFDTFEWDPNAVCIGGNFNQPLWEPPSLYVLGAFAELKQSAGTSSANALCQITLNITSVDPVSGGTVSFSKSTGQGLSSPGAAADEPLTILWPGLTPLYKAFVSVSVSVSANAGTMGVLAGARFWGFRVGNYS